MNQKVKELTASGNATELKHFIYLDRSRLHSYASQLSDGLTQVRRLSETIGRKNVKNPLEEFREETREQTSSAEGSMGNSAVMKVAGKGDKKQTVKSGFKTQTGSAQEASESRNFAEDKVDHDNSYLLLEQDFIQSGILTELSNNCDLDSLQSQMIKITAPTRFFDWSMLDKLLDNPNSLRMLMQLGGVDLENGLLDVSIELMPFLLNIFSIGSITGHLELDGKKIFCSLNPEHFVVTMDQLRGMYILPADVEVTIVGFLPKSRGRSTNITGLAGQFEAADMWKVLVGDVDLVVEPLAIYSNLE